ncbi:MAG: ribbon-helix-helix domain-containing protein [Micrococcales bacterium]|nr:ribbon-helix-helix domain-containing protein [Micrococcales bacterium]
MASQKFSKQAEEVFAAAADEAERGYDVDFLKASIRPVGRPLRIGATTAVSVPVRLDADRISALDAMAARDHQTRSDVIRRAIDRELAGHAG